ncbi:hypothetical protein HDZ31DRAFT_84318 [Schizophyllum fasciatum]
MSSSPAEDDQHALFAAIVRSHLADVTELAAERRAAKASSSDSAPSGNEPTPSDAQPSTDSAVPSAGAPTSDPYVPPNSTLDEDTLLALDLFAAELQRISSLLDDHALAQQLAREDAEFASRGAQEASQAANTSEDTMPDPAEAARRAEARSAEVARLAEEAAAAYLGGGADEETRARQREFARLVRERIGERDRQEEARRRDGARVPMRSGAYQANYRPPARRPASSAPSLASLISQIPTALTSFWKS